MNRWKCRNCGKEFKKVSDTFSHFDKYPNHSMHRIAPKGY